VREMAQQGKTLILAYCWANVAARIMLRRVRIDRSGMEILYFSAT